MTDIITTPTLRDEVVRVGMIGLVGGLLHDALPENEPATPDQPFVFNRFHLSIHPTAGIEDWLKIGTVLQGINIGYQWWVGDWLAFGEDKFADKVAQGVEITGRAENTLRQWAWTSKAFDPSERKFDLPFGHYHAMARVKNKAPEVAKKLLGNAETKSLSVMAVRDQINEWQQAHDPDYGRYHAQAPTPSERGLTPLLALTIALEPYGLGEDDALLILTDVRQQGYELKEKE